MSAERPGPAAHALGGGPRGGSVLLLASPDARRRERSLAQRLAANLAHDCPVRMAELGGPRDEARLIERARGWRATRVVAAGGDGTVSRAAHVALALEVPLGIVPLGTSNSAARALRIPTDLDAASAVALSDALRAIDTAWVEAPSLSRPVPLVLLAAVGLHASAISAAARRSKASLGRAAYLAAGARAALSAAPFAARLEVDGERLDTDARSIVVASFAPRDTMLARGRLLPDDGQLEVTVFRADGRLETLGAMAALGASALLDTAPLRRYARVLAGRAVRLRTDPPMRVLVDGDLLAETPLEIRVAPRSLRVAVPAP